MQCRLSCVKLDHLCFSLSPFYFAQVSGRLSGSEVSSLPLKPRELCDPSAILTMFRKEAYLVGCIKVKEPEPSALRALGDPPAIILRASMIKLAGSSRTLPWSDLLSHGHAKQ